MTSTTGSAGSIDPVGPLRHRVNIPVTMRHLSGGEEWLEIEGNSVPQIIRNLDRRYPGFLDKLMKDDRMAPGVAVVVDGVVTNVLLRPLEKPCELFFVPAIGGG
ncbi:MAG: MoaD/ThiS family protein [Gammaproteobacteria bacterium]|nr:MoaD/ThiS family protein [Gammaproteobacteria bacterium]